MYAGIMSGMNAQRKENTSNRRESTKLFNDYLAKTRELGLDLTEEDLTGNWNSNATGVNRKYAPTRERMQSIIAANTDYNDRVVAKQSFDDLVQSQKVDEMVEKMVTKGFNENIYSEDSTVLNENMLAQFGDNQMLTDSYNLRFGNGMGLSAAHKAYESSQIIDALDKIERLNKGGVFDPKEIQGFLPDVPPHIIAAATEKAKTSYDQSQQVFEEQRFAVQVGNRNSAMAEISTKVKLGDVTPENVKLIMERYKVTDPEQQQMVLDHYQLESKKMSQAGMETYNTQVDTRTAKSNQEIAETIASTKKMNTGNISPYLGEFDSGIIGAVTTLANKYVISLDNINQIKSDIQAKMATDPNFFKKSPQAIQNYLEDYLKANKTPTYLNLESQYRNQAVETIGSKQYTPETFESVYVGDMGYDGNNYLTRLQRASDSGNYPAFMQAQAELKLELERVIHDLSNRRANPQKSFGPYASDEEIQRVMALAYTTITGLQTDAAQIPVPEDTRSKVPQPIQDLVDQAQDRIKTLKSVDGTMVARGLRGSSTPLATTHPDVLAEIEKLEAQITNSLTPYNIQLGRPKLGTAIQFP